MIVWNIERVGRHGASVKRDVDSEKPLVQIC
jgi:hypothetical protein